MLSHTKGFNLIIYKSIKHFFCFHKKLNCIQILFCLVLFWKEQLYRSPLTIKIIKYVSGETRNRENIGMLEPYFKNDESSFSNVYHIY